LWNVELQRVSSQAVAGTGALRSGSFRIAPITVVISTGPTAAIVPPARQLIRWGLTLEKSNAGEIEVGHDVDAGRGDGERQRAQHDWQRAVDPCDRLHRVGDELTEHRRRWC
jgi:hypothetical protein